MNPELTPPRQDPGQDYSSVSLNSVYGLGTLVLLLGIMLFNNTMAAWHQNQWASSQSALQSGSSAPILRENGANGKSPVLSQTSDMWEPQTLHGERRRQRQTYQAIQMRMALYIGLSVFLVLLGIQILLKRCWACHFFVSIRQLARLALVLIPISTFLILSNRPLMDSLSEIYLPMIRAVLQQQGHLVAEEAAQSAAQNPELINRLGNDLDSKLVRRVIRVTFWILGLLGMAFAGLALRLSGRCLRHEVQEALFAHSAPPGRLSFFILCLPPELLLILPLAIYGTVLQLLELVRIFSHRGLASAPGNGLFESISLLLVLAAGFSFAMALLQITNRNMQHFDRTQRLHSKYQLLKKALRFCAAAYLLQFLQNSLLPWWQRSSNESVSPLPDQSLNIEALQSVINRIASLSNLAVLLLLVLLYYILQRSERHYLQSANEQRNDHVSEQDAGQGIKQSRENDRHPEQVPDEGSGLSSQTDLSETESSEPPGQAAEQSPPGEPPDPDAE